MIRMPNLSLKNRIFLAALAAVVLVCAAIAYQSRVILTTTLTRELEERGVGIAESVGYKGLRFILAGDSAGLAEVINDAATLPSRRGLLAYIFVVDNANRILGHSFADDFPEGLLTVNPLPPGASSGIRIVDYQGRKAEDIATPVTAPGGNRIATVHIGLSLEHMERLFSRLRSNSIMFISAMFVLLFLATHWILNSLNEREKRALAERARIQQERVEGLRKMAMAVAHQLRNPIQIIGGYAHILHERCGADPVRCQARMEGIKEAAERIEGITRVVQEYADIRSGLQRPIPLFNLVREAREGAERQTEALERCMTWEIDVDDLWVTVDQELMVQALTEVMKNSVEACTDGSGTIKISAKRDGGWVELVLADDGQGIDPQDLPFVLDPFYTTKAVGVGMGLTKAERIVKEQGGSLAVTNSDVGTDIRIRLPLAS